MGNSRRNQVLLRKAKGRDVEGRDLNCRLPGQCLPHSEFQKVGVNPRVQRLGRDGEESSEKVELHRQEITMRWAQRWHVIGEWIKVRVGCDSVIFLLSKDRGFASAILSNTEKGRIRRNHRGSADMCKKKTGLSRMGKKNGKRLLRRARRAWAGEEMNWGSCAVWEAVSLKEAGKEVLGRFCPASEWEPPHPTLVFSWELIKVLSASLLRCVLEHFLLECQAEEIGSQGCSPSELEGISFSEVAQMCFTYGTAYWNKLCVGAGAIKQILALASGELACQNHQTTVRTSLPSPHSLIAPEAPAQGCCPFEILSSNPNPSLCNARGKEGGKEGTWQSSHGSGLQCSQSLGPGLLTPRHLVSSYCSRTSVALASSSLWSGCWACGWRGGRLGPGRCSRNFVLGQQSHTPVRQSASPDFAQVIQAKTQSFPALCT